MDYITKIENLINALLTRCGMFLVNLIPLRLRTFFAKTENVKAWFKSLPKIIITWSIATLKSTKENLFSYNYKAKLVQTLNAGLARYKTEKPEKIGQFKIFILTPFILVSEWLKGLSVSQSMMLLSFTGASFLAMIGMIFSGQRMLEKQLIGRTPASSAPLEVEYERPGYYKKQTRHLEITNIRLPVYVADINEVRSVDIDIVATMSTRESRMFLEKREFQLRDHLVLNVEPSVASFALVEEGKQIMREKITMEIKEFLKLSKVDGDVLELEITYILAN